MKLLISLFTIVFCLCVSNKATSQVRLQPLPEAINTNVIQKAYADSLQRAWMQDSLGLSNQVIMQVFALRDTCINRTERISADMGLSQAEKSDSLRALRTDTNNEIKTIMGETIFQRYTEMIVGRRTTF